MNSTASYDLTTNTSLRRRYDKTLQFVLKTETPPQKILDLGTPNPFSNLLTSKGFDVINTKGEDLDDAPECVSQFNADFTTAFEIFEHLVNPLSVLRQLPTKKLIASVPLSLWFAKAYKSKTDQWDRHFHEFEDWQFDWLLEKAGWEIIRKEKWTSPIDKIGVRPFLRLITPRYYIVEAVRKEVHL